MIVLYIIKGKMWVRLGEYPSSRSQKVTPYCPKQPLYKPYMGGICWYISRVLSQAYPTFLFDITKGSLVEKLPSYGVLTSPLTSHITHITHITHCSHHSHLTSLTSLNISHQSHHTSRIKHHSHLTSHIIKLLTSHIIHISHLTSSNYSHHTSFTSHISHIT